MKHVAIYVRVSTQDQSNENQVHELTQYVELRGLGAFSVYEDKASGTKTNRPAFQRMMSDVRAGRVSTVVVWKLDRFSRSLKDLLTTLEELKSFGAGFIAVQDNLDLTTASGVLMMHMISAFSQFEASLIKERTLAGLANAKRKGVKFGRPKLVVDGDTIARMSATMSMRAIASAKGISLASVCRIMKAQRAA